MNACAHRTPHIRFAVVCAMLAMTCFALQYGVDAALSDSAGVTLELPQAVGHWVGMRFRYCHNEKCQNFQGITAAIDGTDVAACELCGTPLYAMSEAEGRLLPGDTSFAKAVYTDGLNRTLFVSIVISGKERNSIHRPQRCLVGQGFQIVNTDLIRVPFENGPDLDVKFMETVRSYPGQRRVVAHPSFYVYWFVGQGRETPHHLVRMFWLGWDRVVRGVAHKWAYIAIATGTARSETMAKQEMASFIADFYPRIVVQPRN